MAATSKPREKTHAPKDRDEDKTRVGQEGEAAPRLPHEHDQSSDSQASPNGRHGHVGRQAKKDVDRGLVDTDRGPVTDKVYNDKVKR